MSSNYKSQRKRADYSEDSDQYYAAKSKKHSHKKDRSEKENSEHKKHTKQNEEYVKGKHHRSKQKVVEYSDDSDQLYATTHKKRDHRDDRPQKEYSEGERYTRRDDYLNEEKHHKTKHKMMENSEDSDQYSAPKSRKESRRIDRPEMRSHETERRSKRNEKNLEERDHYRSPQRMKSRYSDELNDDILRKRDKRRKRERSPSDDDEAEEMRYRSLKHRHFEQEAAETPSYRSEKVAESNTTDAKPSDEPISKTQKMANINMKSGGAYIPPARLRMMQEQITDKGSEEYQRMAWEALKKSIMGMTNKINGANIGDVIPELLRENIIRGRGILARAIMQAQSASPTFTRVYAALTAVINTKYPEIGELILKRLILQYKRAFRRNDKSVCMAASRFLAHLLNQEVIHEVLLLEIIIHLLENPTDDSVEIAIATLKECGQKLTQLSAKGMRAVTDRVRSILAERTLDKRTDYLIEVFFQVQKEGFKDFEILTADLDLVEDDDKYTHLLNLDDANNAEEMLNIFKFDPDYLENEEKYKSVAKEILGDPDEDSEGASGTDGDDEEDDEKTEENQKIVDMTETNLICLRRKIYLTIQSSLDFEECAHKLLKLELKEGQIIEMCFMILDCCAQQRTYEKFYGLLGQRFCQINKIYVEPFTEIFVNSYTTIHRLETNKLRNVAKFFAHLLYTDAISWMVLSNVKLNEEDTTSSSRIFIKILFQELGEFMGLEKLNDRVSDLTLQEAFEGLFPRDNPHNARFAINFFTSIGLGGLTDDLRTHLKSIPKTPTVPAADQEIKVESSSSSSSSSETSSESSSSSSSSTSSSSSSSPDEREVKARRKAKEAQSKKKRKR